MTDRISGGSTSPIQQQQEVREKTPSAEPEKGRAARKDVASPIRHTQTPGVQKGGGKSWKERIAKLDGLAQRNKTPNPSLANPTLAKAATGKSTLASSRPPGAPPIPAPYQGPRTLGRGASASRATLSRSTTGSNFNDVRRSKFKEQFQQRTQDYDSRASKLNAHQKAMYRESKQEILSLLKRTPGDTESANEQFRQLASNARMIDDLFQGDSSYLGKLAVGDWN